jgi:hypothetical protein
VLEAGGRRRGRSTSPFLTVRAAARLRATIRPRPPPLGQLQGTTSRASAVDLQPPTSDYWQQHQQQHQVQGRGIMTAGQAGGGCEQLPPPPPPPPPLPAAGQPVLLRVKPSGHWRDRLKAEGREDVCQRVQELEVTRADTVDVVMQKLQEKWGLAVYPDMQVLALDYGNPDHTTLVELERRATVQELCDRWNDHWKASSLSRTNSKGQDVLEMLLNTRLRPSWLPGPVQRSGSYLEWCLFCLCSLAALVFTVLLVVMGIRVTTIDSWQLPPGTHGLLVGSFFGVIAAGSMVFCLCFLVPRYTEKRGVRGSNAQMDALASETWIWSFTVNGLGAWIKVLVLELGLAWLKFSQLFALTYVRALHR